MISVGELMVSRGGSVNPLQFPDEEFDLYSIPAFDAGQPEIALGAEIGSTKQIIQPNDVLLSKIVPHIRRAWVVGDDRGRRLIGSGEWIVFRSEKVFPSYLRHVLVGDPFHQQFMQTVSGVGGSLLRARPAFVASIQIPLPPLEEQRRIAAILDQAETLRTQRRTALALQGSLTQSLFLDMFGAGDSQGWPVTSIGEIVDEENGGIRTGPFGSQLLHSEFVDEGVAVLGIDNAVNNEFRWGERRYIAHAKYKELKRYTVRPGDVLITIMGTCGRCAVVPDDIPLAINTKHLCCISVDRSRVVPDYLHAYFLRHPTARKYLEQTAKGAIMSGLNMGIIKAMPIALPPLPLQQTFATRIASIEALKATHRRALAALDAMFASLQQRAFAGLL
ncbi:restriction endonuclease subunit S [Acidovorax sp. HMWF029]|uniref:restriction endonuclease subunit S n=1 Tax=Acidovorax sp. HMWF029 TaxID=2056863 RepID=UPI0018EE52F6|nr:restriction endonuclease subunit S [Acidovorax sp. HMWF029]